MWLPVVSTIGVILPREGLVTTRRRRRTARPTTGPLREAIPPNDVWAMDFKGQFRTGKTYCYPFTVSDQYSRYLLGCEGLEGTQGGPARAVLASVFREFGSPQPIRSDNGSPFASTGRHGLTRLAVWLIRQGISQTAHRARTNRPERTPRADAPNAHAGDDPARLLQSPRTAGAI